MARYQVILAYDGTDFFGFQRQASSRKIRTVQGVFEAALGQIGWRGDKILAAGRTDTGVHAAGQVVTFDLDWAHGETKLLAALNAHLPKDIAAKSIIEAEADFHPRFEALARRYRYRIFCQPVRDPLRERYAWRVWPAADLERMKSAAALLIGHHDFAAFGTPTHSGGTTLRHVINANWLANADELYFEIKANAFLFRMVRRLVAFQVSIGQQILEVEAITHCLCTGEKELVKNIAPAQGLSLVEVIYPVIKKPDRER